jgi:acyl carrier protein
MTVFDQIKQLLEHQAGVRPEDIKLQSNLVDDFGLDDLDIAEFTMHLEQNFGIQIPDQEGKLRTVEDFVNYITNHLQAP